MQNGETEDANESSMAARLSSRSEVEEMTVKDCRRVCLFSGCKHCIRNIRPYVSIVFCVPSTYARRDIV